MSCEEDLMKQVEELTKRAGEAEKDKQVLEEEDK